MRHSRSVIGIDVGGRNVHMAQLERGGERPRLLAWARLPRSEPGGPLGLEEAGRIGGVLFRRGFKGARVALAVPHELHRCSVLELPPRSSGAPIEQIARVEMAREHSLDPAALQMAMWDLPRPARAGDATHVMVVACPHEAAGSLLDAFEDQGLVVEALDTRSWSLARACAALAGPGVSAVLDLSWSGGLVVVLCAGSVVYERWHPGAAISALHATLCRELGVGPDVADHLVEHASVEADGARRESDGGRMVRTRALVAAYAESLVEELRASLSYATHRYPEGGLSRLLLTGAGAAMGGLAERLAEELGIEVRVAWPGEAVDAETAASRPGPGLMAAIGLAMHEE